MSTDEKTSQGDGRPTLSKEEREARKVFREVEAEKAMSDDAIAKKAFADNHQRLKAERQAREAAGPPAAAEAKPKKKAK